MKCDTTENEYLCQVSETVSCGACCGLYNVEDVSFSTLSHMLANRSEIFARTPREMDSILSFKEKIDALESQKRPLPDFHHCSFIGLIGKDNGRVGCLLHPLVKGNNGIDFRGLSYYGGMTCNMYFCPSVRKLSKPYGKLVKEIVKDWYLYGLIITETKLIIALFQEVERHIGEPLTEEVLQNCPELKDSILDLFKLKTNWPFRPDNAEYIGNYFFNDNLSPKPAIDYTAIHQTPSKYHYIFQELVTTFNSKEALAKAERLLEDIFLNMRDP